MVMDAVVERFMEQSPVTVMARLALQRALDPAWVDALFEQERREQYKGELLFSTAVELMSVVAVGQRPSLHAAAKACQALPVSVQALYGKINRTEPALVRALVRSSAERLRPVVAPMHEGKSPMARNYRVKLVDGNHLAASDKRIKPLRGFRGAALPGHSLVIYDPDLEMAVDLVPCEDGHAQERSLSASLLAFGVAVLAYNVLAVLQAAVRATHDLQAAGIELSSYYFAADVKAHYAGMMVAITVAAWRAYDALSAPQLGQLLLQMAAHADPVALRKHPRGPKPPKKKGYAPAAVARRHVATARVLKEGRVK